MANQSCCLSDTVASELRWQTSFPSENIQMSLWRFTKNARNSGSESAGECVPRTAAGGTQRSDVSLRASASRGRAAVNKRIIRTRYCSPREFYGYFRSDFSLQHHRDLRVFAPPPYIVSMHKRHPVWHELLSHIDRRLAGWPLLRSIGDHSLIVMRKR
jgi:hypothetical protein